MRESTRAHRRSVAVLRTLAVCGLLASCAGSADERQGAIRVALASVPMDVSCVRVSVQGTRLVQQDFDVAPGNSTLLGLSGLPIGAVQVSGAAFGSHCGSSNATETWVADPVNATLEVGAVATVKLVMHRNGAASISVTFQDDVTDAGAGGHATAVDGGAAGTGGGSAGASGGAVGTGGGGAPGMCQFSGSPGPFVNLGSLGSGLTVARDLNDLGQVVGRSADLPFLWEAGSMRNLGPSGDTSGEAQAINNHGQVAGTLGNRIAVRWENGVMTLLGTPFDRVEEVHALTDSGRLLIRSTDFAPPNQQHVIVQDQGGRHEVLPLYGGTAYASSKKSINDRGQVVGFMDAAPGQGQRAFLWSDGETIDLGTLGGDWAYAAAINNAGQIVGAAAGPDGKARGFLWQDGVMHDLTSEGASGCLIALDITQDGQVVCNGHGLNPYPNPLVWRAGNAHYIFGPIDLTTNASAINDCGLIAGEMTVPGGLPADCFMWQSGQFARLGVPSGEAWVYPVGLNNRGDYLLESSAWSAAYLVSWR